MTSSASRLALSATLHCLAGCSIGEALGMIAGNVADLSNAATVALSVALGVAGIVAYPANRWLILRGRGHALVHPHLGRRGHHH
jgi:hypothetical protein